MAQICTPSCVTNIPSVLAGACNITTRIGGISRLTFLKCDNNITFPNAGGWTNLANVEWAICTGLLFVTGEILGQKPKGSVTKRRLSSCAPEETVSGVQTVTFQDYNASATQLDVEFWNAIKANKKFLSLGYITCDGRWFQYNGAWDIEIGDVIEDTFEGKSYYDGVVTIATDEILTPVITPGILEMISGFNQANCNY